LPGALDARADQVDVIGVLHRAMIHDRRKARDRS